MKKLFVLLGIIVSFSFAGMIMPDGGGGFWTDEGHYQSDGAGGLWTPNGDHIQPLGNGFYMY